MLYKYLLTWVNDQPPASDTGGLFFPKALHHVFVGLYIQQVCLCALFFLGKAIPQGALMVVIIAFTAFFQNLIINSYGPLLKFLPLTLADRSYNQSNRRPVPSQAPAHPSIKEEDDIQAKDFALKQEGPSAVSNAPVDVKANGTTESFSDHGVQSRSASPSPSAKPVDAEEAEEVDFWHPAAVEPQPVIWLPRDLLGLVDESQRGIREEGIETTCEGAEMNAKGHVDVKSAPPEETRKSFAGARGGVPQDDDDEEEEGDAKGWRLRVSESSKA
ncbi:hypothetical protein OF83DRAFT_1071203 [Amylostereum chailletii]|nr:hypothetical protein OF83DRAFT_1071203 [Amylostereum chailletii]